MSESERDAPGAGRSAMGGFVEQHWSEVDRDGDGVVAGAEIRRNAQSMFDRADRDDDGLVTTAELSEPRPQGGGGQGGGGKGYAALQSGFLTEVPAHPFDAILVRPLPTSIALSVVDYGGGEALVEYGPVGEAMQPTRPQALRAGEPTLFELTGLRPDAAHTYRLRRRAVVGLGAVDGGDERTCRPPRAPGARFRCSER
ncbi:MAG: hypothetical protein ACK5BN_01165, partial [Planctomycetota bacterium]